MKYQIPAKDAPYVERELKHGLLIKGTRQKLMRVRMSFAADKRNLKQTDQSDRNLEYYGRLVSFVDLPDVQVTFEMMTNLSETDFEEIVKMSAEADKLDIEDPKLPNTSAD